MLQSLGFHIKLAAHGNLCILINQGIRNRPGNIDCNRASYSDIPCRITGLGIHRGSCFGFLFSCNSGNGQPVSC